MRFICIYILMFSALNIQCSVTSSKYNLKRILWDKFDLTYSLHGNVAYRNQTKQETVRKVLNEAFSEWQRNSCFKFRDVSPSKYADIKVIFTRDSNTAYFDSHGREVVDPLSINYSHFGCERRFRGSAAHAFFRYHKKYPANIHVNNEIFYMESKNPPGSISLKTVLLHEIGHVLGLYHSKDLNSVMYEFIFTNRVLTISYKDRNDLNKLYKDSCKSYMKKRKHRA